MSKTTSIILIIILGIIAGFLVYFFYPNQVDNKVKIYFSNNLEDPETFDCGKVYPVKRVIQDELNIPFMTLGELLLGPSESEINQGYFTNINHGVGVQELIVDEGIARVDFSEELTKDVSGSCIILGIESQIKKTLLQFNHINDVIISINGKVDVLQP